MDLFMPTMDGITATRLIRAREALRTPIVAVTAQCLAGDKEACLTVQPFLSSLLAPLSFSILRSLPPRFSALLMYAGAGWNGCIPV